MKKTQNILALGMPSTVHAPPIFKAFFWIRNNTDKSKYIPRNETARPPSKFLHSCYWERFIYSQDLSYLDSLFSFIAWENTRLNPQEQREGQGTATNQGLAAIPCPPLRSCGWAECSHKWPTYKFPIWKIMDRKWKQLILEVNFFFSLRVNEIPNILDSHRPSVCSVVVLLCSFPMRLSTWMNYLYWLPVSIHFKCRNLTNVYGAWRHF